MPDAVGGVSDGWLHPGIADASNVILADRHRTTTILTLDQRHFRRLRPLWGRHPFHRASLRRLIRLPAGGVPQQVPGTSGHDRRGPPLRATVIGSR
jgi:hypothetical protein